MVCINDINISITGFQVKCSQSIMADGFNKTVLHSEIHSSFSIENNP